MIRKRLRSNQGVWAHFEGQTYFINQKKTAAKNTSSLNEASGILTSPMPGKILNILCKSGDLVDTTQTLCIIEAMKMEYSLKAPFKGKIKSLHKAIGNQVLLGEKIIELEKI